MLSFTDPRNTPKTSKGRPGGGWDDDILADENMTALKTGDKQPFPQSSPTNQSTQPSSPNSGAQSAQTEFIQITEDLLSA